MMHGPRQDMQAVQKFRLDKFGDVCTVSVSASESPTSLEPRNRHNMRKIQVLALLKF